MLLLGDVRRSLFFKLVLLALVVQKKKKKIIKRVDSGRALAVQIISFYSQHLFPILLKSESFENLLLEWN